ncbi:MAG: hypothetical protein J6A78_02715 [Clostridia bacterium]|nr:hypothetical protein [Clostridia bacterium]
MKKLYLEYFKISANGKITDKVMLGRVISTVAIILVCTVLMSITAFAFFTSDASSSVTPLTSASFDVDIAVNGSNVDVVGVLDGTKEIKISVKDTSTATTGYCVVKIGDKEYITEQFIRGENGGYNTVTFTINLAEPTLVTVEARWGTSSLYAGAVAGNKPTNYIENNDIIDLVPNSSTPPTQPDNTNNEPAVENNEAENGNQTNNEAETENQENNEQITE